MDKQLLWFAFTLFDLCVLESQAAVRGFVPSPFMSLSCRLPLLRIPALKPTVMTAPGTLLNPTAWIRNQSPVSCCGHALSQGILISPRISRNSSSHRQSILCIQSLAFPEVNYVFFFFSNRIIGVVEPHDSFLMSPMNHCCIFFCPSYFKL